jgi:hypothetical protein
LMTKNRIIPLLFVLLGTLDFIYGIIRHDLISLGIGAIMIGIALFILKKAHNAV